jgi:hypothetical protein
MKYIIIHDKIMMYESSVIREYIREFSKKFETAPREYSWAQGTLIHEKNLKSKISCQTPPINESAELTQGPSR